jgi:tight adherence protein C
MQMTPDLLVGMVAVFLSVALFSGVATASALRLQTPERRRLREMSRGGDRDAPDRVLLTDAPNALAERIARLLPRSAERREQIRQRLVASGRRSPSAPVAFTAAQVIGGVAACALVLLLGGGVALALIAVVPGYLIPELWLTRRIAARARAIRNGLADVLDLLIVCLESGCSLDHAILKSGEELAMTYPALGDELAVVAHEIRAGKPRGEALQNLASRTRVDEMRSLVAMLVQTDRYGTSIAGALRMHADLFRTRRRQVAEEQAAKASVKLVFPLVFCLFPAFYLVSLGPALLQFIRVFADAVLGG